MLRELLNQIKDGVRERQRLSKSYSESYLWGIKGKGSKQYISKRIDVLREELLEIKKGLK